MSQSTEGHRRGDGYTKKSGLHGTEAFINRTLKRKKKNKKAKASRKRNTISSES